VNHLGLWLSWLASFKKIVRKTHEAFFVLEQIMRFKGWRYPQPNVLTRGVKRRSDQVLRRKSAILREKATTRMRFSPIEESSFRRLMKSSGPPCSAAFLSRVPVRGTRRHLFAYSRGKTPIRSGPPAKVYLQDELSPANEVVRSDDPEPRDLSESILKRAPIYSCLKIEHARNLSARTLLIWTSCAS
jgi:hypothetical protein